MISNKYIVYLSVCCLNACSNNHTTIEVNSNDTVQLNLKDTFTSSIEFLNGFRDRYPNEVNLLKIAVLEQRIKKLIGNEYNYILSIWEVETPMEVINGEFYAWGMQAHSGGDKSAVIMANIKQDKLYVGVRNESVVNIYAEDSTSIPNRLLDWKKDGRGENIQ